MLQLIVGRQVLQRSTLCSVLLRKSIQTQSSNLSNLVMPKYTASSVKCCNFASRFNLSQTRIQQLSTSQVIYSKTLYDGTIPPAEVKNEEFEVIYFFPFIRVARVITRLKLWQTGFTFGLLPVMSVLYSYGKADIQAVQACVGLASLAGVMLYIMSSYSQRTIGFLSLNKTEDIVRVSHLTFWGKRMDTFIPLEKIIPITDLPDKASDVYIKFRWEENKNYLYLSIRHGQILDHDKFTAVMGSLNE